MFHNAYMTDVHFYFNVPHKLHFGCRLARKAFSEGKPVVITAPGALMTQFDELLWNMEQADFLAHDRLDGHGDEVRPLAPLLLIERVEGMLPLASHFQRLISLWDEVPPGFSHFERVYELVSQSDEQDRQNGRRRWRYYQQRGYALHGHDLARQSS